MNFMRKNREMILYMFFGTLTVAVNFFTYLLMSKINDNTAVDTAVALAASIIVAYLTNRKMVFKSEHHGAKAICAEFAAFVSFRIFSGIIDVSMMVFFVDFLHKNDLIVKFFSNCVVIAINYVCSKWLVFRER